MSSAEHVLYPELERMYQNRHSMTPMRREHVEIRALIAELPAVRASERHPGGSVGRAVALRRLLFRLYGLLKVHLAEERIYGGIVKHDASPESSDALADALAAAERTPA